MSNESLKTICCWMPGPNERKCQDQATHWHEAYGEICPTHAARLIAQKEKVVRLGRHRAGLKGTYLSTNAVSDGKAGIRISEIRQS